MKLWAVSKSFLFQILFFVHASFYTNTNAAKMNIDSPEKNNSFESFKALVFSKTSGFRHSSIPNGIAAIQQLGVENNFEVDATEDPNVFTDSSLSQYKVVIFLCTTGDVLNNNQQAAFERYIRAGGGYAGIHSAADTEYDWEWYGNLVGAYFKSHPAIQKATIIVADPSHPSTDSLPQRWSRTDEWYNFKSNPRGNVHVLATLDESTYSGGENGFDHPIVWCRKYEGGRSWFTALGHTEESYTEPYFLKHLLGGILFAAGIFDGDYSTIDSNFKIDVLDDDPLNPMSLAAAPDGRIFYVERGGAVKFFSPSDSSINIAGNISVTTVNEDGLLGIALDPNFTVNNWIYLFYSPEGSEAKQHLSRFTLVNDELDMASEKILLEIPTQRDQCCHSGGSLAFGPDGNLYISTGDNTNPFDSDGYSPIDERPGRSPWDAQTTSSNTNDLRGKILRITLQDDGSYSIPEGNLFLLGDSLRRPEIFVMGCRNPFRISIDSSNGWLYWGDVGPDANENNPSRGPKGYDEWNQAREAGYYGWPYFIGNNFSYIDYNFADSISGLSFDPNNPINDSPNNTGAIELPIAKLAWIWYPYGPSSEFPEISAGPGRTAMAGPVYHFDSTLNSEIKLPEYYDNTLFIYEWSRNWIKEVKLDSSGNILKINPFLDNISFRRPMDMEMGPDGAIYMLEWGSNFSGNNTDSKLIRISYNRNILPVEVEEESGAKFLSSYRLFQNYPNPFNPRTTISYSLPENSDIDLSIYNLLGQKIATIFSGSLPAGNYKNEWDASAFGAGVYFYRLKTGSGFTQTKKLILLK
jgi:glucose/arabinose dehydrogenase